MPLTEGIVASLIANALTELIRTFTPTLGRNETHIPVLEAVQGDKELETILRKAIVSVAKEIRLEDPKNSEKLQMFLISPDAEAIVRQMYGLWLMPESKTHSESQLRDEFTLLLSIHIAIDAHEIEIIARELFQALMSGCQVALKNAVARGILIAHDVKSERRFRLLSDELASIERNLELLRQPQKPVIEEIVMFEDRYRLQMIQRHGYITPPHFDIARKIPIRDICVTAKLIRDPERQEEKPTVVSYEGFLSTFYRGVILGNPGGGKSTLAGKICFDLASEYRQRLLAGRQVTPILVVLRDYGAAKKQSHVSIAQFMAQVANSHYQLPPPNHAFEYLLLNGRAMVIFDGLDELLDTSYRREITSDIESFCNLYPSVPALITSREVGYEQAPLDKQIFTVFKLAPFDENQVHQYVQKWFAADTDEIAPPLVET